MPSVYLQSSDYTSYGVATSTTSAQITQASAIIDGYLRRKLGCIWAQDYQGNPCYMLGAAPLYTLTSSGTISSGTTVNVRVTGGLSAVQQGDVAILDRANANLVEACIVSSVNLQTKTLTLKSVANNHTSNCTLDFGMTLMEELTMPEGRPITNLSQWPVLNLISGVGQYGYSRRGNTDYYALGTLNLLSVMTAFGGPPGWEAFDTTITGIDPLTGRVWVPSGVLLAYYTQVRLWYIAGWTYATLPYEIKQACANIVNSALNYPLNGPIKMARAGDTALERFSSTYLDDDTKNLLDPFRARVF